MATKKAAAPAEPKPTAKKAAAPAAKETKAAPKKAAAPKKTAAPAKEEIPQEEAVKEPEIEDEDVVKTPTQEESKEENKEAVKEVFAESAAKARRKNRSAITNFARSQDTVLTVDGEERVSNAVDEYSKSLIDLSMSKSNGMVLRDRIDSIERRGDVYAAVVYHGPFKVYIPASKIIQGKLDPLPGATLVQTYGYVMQSYLGAEVEYICTDVVTDDGAMVATGDHISASKAYQKRFFIDKERMTGLPRVREGRVVEARILSVRRFGVRLNIFGFEKFVPTNLLTYNRIEYANREFAVDQIIEVKITKVEIENNEVKDVQISVKELKADPLRKALERCKPRAIYPGVVEMIDEKAIFVTVSFGDVKATCYCPYPNVGIKIGSTVTLRVRDVDMDNLQFWGNIIRVNNI